jgi:hypothetical protein
VKVTDRADNDFVCLFNELKDLQTRGEEGCDTCVADAVVGRYAEKLKFTDPIG